MRIQASPSGKKKENPFQVHVQLNGQRRRKEYLGSVGCSDTIKENI